MFGWDFGKSCVNINLLSRNVNDVEAERFLSNANDISKLSLLTPRNNTISKHFSRLAVSYTI